MGFKEELTYMQKAALEGEIGIVIDTASHMAELIYRLYSILVGVPEEYKEYVLECFHELTDIPEEVYQKVLLEIAFKSVPLWIWVNRAVSDLKGAIGVLDEGGSTIPISKRKIESRKKIVISSFLLFCREVNSVCPTATRLLCEKIVEEQSLDFLNMACFETLEILKEEKRKEGKIDPDIMSLAFNIREVLSFKLEKDIIDEMAKPKKKEKKKAKKVAVNEDTFKSLLEEAAQPLKEPYTTYVVKKVFKDSGDSTVLKEFTTKEEALEFISHIIAEFPLIEQVCTFLIMSKINRR